MELVYIKVMDQLAQFFFGDFFLIKTIKTVLFLYLTHYF